MKSQKRHCHNDVRSDELIIMKINVAKIGVQANLKLLSRECLIDPLDCNWLTFRAHVISSKITWIEICFLKNTPLPEPPSKVSLPSN